MKDKSIDVLSLENEHEFHASLAYIKSFVEEKQINIRIDDDIEYDYSCEIVYKSTDPGYSNCRTYRIDNIGWPDNNKPHNIFQFSDIEDFMKTLQSKFQISFDKLEIGHGFKKINKIGYVIPEIYMKVGDVSADTLCGYTDRNGNFKLMDLNEIVLETDTKITFK